MSEDITFKPHPGPQSEFLSTHASICLFGGSAGGGKSHALLLDPLRNINHPDFKCIFFRRNATELNRPGGLVDESKKIFPYFNGTYYSSQKVWRFPSGAAIHFMGLDSEDDLQALRGVQVSRIYFDELTTFTMNQFWYPQSRLRNTSGLSTKVKTTTNPESSGFVKDLISWWIDKETGFAIPERSGVVRYFTRSEEGEMVWFDSEEEAKVYCRDVLGEKEEDMSVTSFTFIRSSLDDNPSLGKDYLKRLKSLGPKERAELLGGNWNYDATSGVYFQKDWVEVIEPYQVPKIKKEIRGWDLASTPVDSKTNRNPDWTAGVKIGLGEDGYYYITDLVRFRESIGTVKKTMLRTAIKDGTKCHITVPLDPGGHGKHAFQDHVRNLSGFVVKKAKTEKSKLDRFLPFSSAAEHGLVKVVRADWNDDFFKELEGFVGDGKRKDDQVDAVSDAYKQLQQGKAVPTDITFDLDSMYEQSIWNI